MVVYTLEQRWEVGLQSTYRRWRFFQKNHLFRWSSFWSWRVCKQAKLWHFGHRKPSRIHWKGDASKTSHCLVRILVQKHNGAIFLRKWAKRGRCSQWRSLSGHVARIFVHKNWRGGYWQYLPKLHWMFCVLFLKSRRADVVCPPRSWDLIPLGYYL